MDEDLGRSNEGARPDGAQPGAEAPPAWWSQPTPPAGQPYYGQPGPPPAGGPDPWRGATPPAGQPGYWPGGPTDPLAPPAQPGYGQGVTPPPAAQSAYGAGAGTGASGPVGGGAAPWWAAAAAADASPGRTGGLGGAGFGQPPWSQPGRTAERGGPGQPPPVPPATFYGQHHGWPDRYGIARYGADPVVAQSRRARRVSFAAVLTLVLVALLAGGLGAGLGVAFGNPSSTAVGSSGTPNGGVPGAAGGSGTIRPPAGNSGSSSTPGSTLPATSGNSNLVRNIANAVDPAVVDIDVEDASAGPAAGTGMIMTSSGYVLTNNHVIDSSTSVEVTVAGHSSSYPGKVVGYDAADDVAVVKIEGVSGLPTVNFGNSAAVSVGDTVVAIGNALGQGGPPTVVSGTITALGRTISAGDEVTGVPETLHNLLQTDAEIQPGDSGGPLVDAKGQVIGMDTAAASAESGSTLGFAIPIDQARSIASQIMAGKSGNGVTVGLAAFLGIDVENNSTGNGTGGGGGIGFPFGSTGESGGASAPPISGVTISSVVADSPAAQAGLQGGDVIVSIDGKATPNFVDLHSDIQAHQPGEQITVGYVDDTGARHSVTVTLAGIPY